MDILQHEGLAPIGSGDSDRKQTVEYDQEGKYWAALEKEEIGSHVIDRVNEYYERLLENGTLELWGSAHAAFYGSSTDGRHETSKIIEFGEDGEKLGAKSNQLRSLVRYIHISATADRPALRPKAVNSTASALAQVPTGRRVLEYYYRVKRMERHLRSCVLRSLIYGLAYLWQYWDPTEQSPDGAGDLRYKSMSPLDVAKDLDRDPYDNDWFVIRRLRNRHDMIATYAPGDADPDLREEILHSQRDCLGDELSIQSNFYRSSMREHADTIYEYIFIHGKTPAMPSGRYTIVLPTGTVVFDGDLPYDEMPVSELCPEEFLEMGGLGYASAWDLLGLQQAYDGILSICLTNLDAWGENDILLPDGVELGLEEVRGGLNVIRYPMGEQNKPSMLEKFSIRDEVFKLKDWAKSDMELATGANSVARGEPEASLKSGAALALVQAQAIHFQSGLLASYNDLIEDAGTGSLRILRKFLPKERLAAICGANDPDGLMAFAAPSLDLVDRLEVERVNPIFRTSAGKFDMANNLMDKQAIKNVDQYVQVVETGRLEPTTDPARLDSLFAESVREFLMQGPPVVPQMTTDPATGAKIPATDPRTGQPLEMVEGLAVTVADNPELCARAAKTVLASMENRRNPQVVNAATVYLSDVMRKWRQAPPDLLMALGYPLPPSAGMMPPGGQGGGQKPPAPSGGENDKGTPPAPPGAGATTGPDQGSSMPSLPKPAQDPLAGER